MQVRERAKAIVELLHDEKRLKSEREKAKQTSKKFSVTMDSDRARYGGTGGGGFGIFKKIKTIYFQRLR